jgi:DNA-binding IscR family transcriptional regulator
LKVENPTSETCDKVLGVLKASEVALSANAIQEATGTNYASVMACLNLLVKDGLVKAVGTSNGVFYSFNQFKNVSECGC